MSYYHCQHLNFTHGQAMVMQGDYLKPKRDYIKNAFVPNMGTITQSAQLVYPTDNEEINPSPTVLLEWEEVPNAKWYLLEVFPKNNFVNSQTFLITYTFDIFESNQTFFWRV